MAPLRLLQPSVLILLLCGTAALAQTHPAATAPTPSAAMTAVALALKKLPRYTGAPIIFADRDPGTHQTLEALQRIPAKFECTDIPLKAALERLALETASNFSVHWTILTKAGITRETKVTLRLGHVTYHKILTLLLAAVSPPGHPLAYQIQEGAVVVSTQEVFAARHEFAAYDLTNFVTVFFNHNIPVAQQDKRAAELLELIPQDIAPGHWKTGEYTLGNFRRTLLITAPTDVQLQIAQMLADIQSPAKLPKAPSLLRQSDNRPAASAVLQKPYAGPPLAAALGPALQQVQNSLDLNLQVAWPALAAAGITPESPASVTPKNSPAGAVLQAVLESAAGKPGVLDFVLDDEGVVAISTAADLAGQTVVGVYDLRDWVKRQQFRARDPKPTADDLIPPVTAALQASVAPDTWDKTASIHNFQGELIINATVGHHRAIFEKLAALAKPN